MKQPAMVSNFKRWLHRYVKNTKRTLIPLAVLKWCSDVTGRQTAGKIFSLSNQSGITLRTSYHHSKISYQNCSLRKVVNECLHQRCLTEGAVLSMRWLGCTERKMVHDPSSTDPQRSLFQSLLLTVPPNGKQSLQQKNWIPSSLHVGQGSENKRDPNVCGP